MPFPPRSRVELQRRAIAPMCVSAPKSGYIGWAERPCQHSAGGNHAPVSPRNAASKRLFAKHKSHSLGSPARRSGATFLRRSEIADERFQVLRLATSLISSGRRLTDPGRRAIVRRGISGGSQGCGSKNTQRRGDGGWITADCAVHGVSRSSLIRLISAMNLRFQ